MVVDTSVIVAIMLKESGYHELFEKIVGSLGSRISAVSYMEASMVLLTRRGESIVHELDELLLELGAIAVPVSVEQARLAVEAFRLYGKGRHPAGLNFGDCFSYALAKSVGEPLLFKGSDFSKTDIASA